MTKNRMRACGFVPFLFLAAATLAAQEPFRLQEATIEQIQAALQSKCVTCRELIGHYLKRIEAYDQAGPKLNAVQTVNKEALNEAERLDAVARSAGPVGPLHCIPVLVKDQVETSDMPTTYGSILFKEFTPRRDAAVVKKLRTAGLARPIWESLPPVILARYSASLTTLTSALAVLHVLASSLYDRY